MNGMNVKHSSGKRLFASRFYFKMKMYSCGHGLRPSAVFAITSPAVAKLTAFFKIHTQFFFFQSFEIFSLPHESGYISTNRRSML